MPTMILLTGAHGQLGQCFKDLANSHPDLAFTFVGSKELDITDNQSVINYFAAHPDIRWCINCAAYTAVDKAESDQKAARATNVTGLKNLATACAAANIPLIHFSTDYVYHGRINRPLTETDPVSPKGVYARTKLAGERIAAAIHPQTMIIRTSWVYAAKGNNFVRTMLRLGNERPQLNVVFDQIGTPTYAPDLAEAVLEVIRQVNTQRMSIHTLGGIWHYSNEGVTSWYDFAQAIFEIEGLDCKVLPIESHQYPTPAKRPPFSVLNKAKFKTTFGVEIPHWRASLIRCLQEIAAQ